MQKKDIGIGLGLLFVVLALYFLTRPKTSSSTSPSTTSSSPIATSSSTSPSTTSSSPTTTSSLPSTSSCSPPPTTSSSSPPTTSSSSPPVTTSSKSSSCPPPNATAALVISNNDGGYGVYVSYIDYAGKQQMTYIPPLHSVEIDITVAAPQTITFYVCDKTWFSIETAPYCQSTNFCIANPGCLICMYGSSDSCQACGRYTYLFNGSLACCPDCGSYYMAQQIILFNSAEVYMCTGICNLNGL